MLSRGTERLCFDEFSRNILWVFILFGRVVVAMCSSNISVVLILSMCLSSFTDNVKGADTTSDSYYASMEPSFGDIALDYNTSKGWEFDNKKTSIHISYSFPINVHQTPPPQDLHMTTFTPEMNTDDLMDMISNFNNDDQRNIVRNQLSYCPYADLCTVSSLLSFNYTYYAYKGPCCQRCSCDRKTCFI